MKINVAKILKNAPKERKLYSRIYGEVTFDAVLNDGTIRCIYNKVCVYFNKYGKMDSNGEVLLFPEKDTLNWRCWGVLIRNGDIVVTENPINHNIVICKAIATDTVRGFFDINGNKTRYHRILRWADKKAIKKFKK